MFGVNNAKDKLKLLVCDFERLKLSPLDISLALKACSDAWHLSDWVFEESCANTMTSKEVFRIDLYKQCPEMRILHDLANTDKHKTLRSPKAQILSTNNHVGDFDGRDFASEDFDCARLEVYSADGTTFEVESLIKVAIDYWQQKII